MIIDELTQRGIDEGLPLWEARTRARQIHSQDCRMILRKVLTPQIERDESGRAIAFYPSVRR